VRQKDALDGLAAEEAITVIVGGETTFVLWPSCFMDALNDELNGMKITTRDGVLRVYRNRPWLD
jgi:hypothetical protein